MFIDNICIRWSEIDECSYLNNIKAINNIKELEFNYPITFFAGENGSGKSTLLEALAIATGFNPEGGTKNYNFAHIILIQIYMKLLDYQEHKKKNGDIF
ncbi:putative ATPase [Peptoniphilus olsenii]|uniref:ATPase n=1 Tax=Peptoniphilus olsenii TaxID=411570 RepID=A0ABV2JAD3_9FIRM